MVDFTRLRRGAVSALPIAVILVVAALVRGWQLWQNGFGREYYAAAVRGMLSSWHNVYFNAFDPAGFVSLDKPPLAIWLQALSAKVLGFSGIAVLVPQVLLGVVSVYLIYRLIDGAYGRKAALAAAALLALTPVSVAVDRSNNTESLLIALLLAATLLGIRAALSGSLPWLCAAMSVIGLGFNVKMGAALVLAPVLALAFSFQNRNEPLGWHLSRHALAGCALVVVSLAWVVSFDLTPAPSRPYAGSTRTNSMLELALVHNGAARFRTIASLVSPVEQAARHGGSGTSADQPGLALTDTSPTGPLRLFRPRQAAQAGWLLPLALAGIWLAFRIEARPRASPRTFLTAAVMLGWLALYWALLSAAGGPVHTYYLAILAPPLSAFAGIALAVLLERWHAGGLPARWLVMLALATIGWQIYLFVGQAGIDPANGLLAYPAAGAGLIASSVAVLVLIRPKGARAAMTAVAGLAGLLLMPLLAVASVVLAKPNTAAPYADVARLAASVNGARSDTRERLRAAARDKLLAFLTANQGAAKYLVAVPNAVVAAPLIVATGRPMMAMGGYLGDDPILTPARLQRLVTDGELRFVMLGGFTLAPERQQAASAGIESWVRANGRVVDERSWRLVRSGGPFVIQLGDTRVQVPEPKLYDLRPVNP